MNDVVHTAIHHDPEGRCNEYLREYGPYLREFFHKGGFVVVTRETVYKRVEGNDVEKEAYHLLREAGLRIIARSLPRARQIDTSANIALLAGYKKGEGENIFFSCLDRTLHWVATYKDELKSILKKGLSGGVDYLILGRTQRALETHPRPQLDPEMATNGITAGFLGIPGVDVATGCRLMTKETAQGIVRFLGEIKRFTNKGIDISDSLWPYIAFRLLHKRLGFLRTEGLEFETPDQYKDEIKSMGYAQWEKSLFTAANIESRWQRTRQTEIALQEFSQFSLANKERIRV